MEAVAVSGWRGEFSNRPPNNIQFSQFAYFRSSRCVKKDWRKGNRKNKIVVILATSVPTLRCVVCIEYLREFERSWWSSFQLCRSALI
jgi:hypothetical protein